STRDRVDESDSPRTHHAGGKSLERTVVRRDLLRDHWSPHDARDYCSDLSHHHHDRSVPWKVQARRRRSLRTILALRRSGVDVRLPAGLSDVREGVKEIE